MGYFILNDSIFNKSISYLYFNCNIFYKYINKMNLLTKYRKYKKELN